MHKEQVWEMIQSGDVTLNLSEWQDYLGDESCAKWITEEFLVPLPESLLQGRIEDILIDNEKVECLMEIDGDNVVLSPTDRSFDPVIRSKKDMVLLRTSRLKYLERIALINEIADKVSLNGPEYVFQIGVRKAADKKVLFLSIFDQAMTEREELSPWLNELTKKFATVVLAVPNRKNVPNSITHNSSVCIVTLPNDWNDWVIEKNEYCRPNLGYLAHEAAEIFTEKSVTIDVAAQTIFIFGRELKLTVDSLEHRYLMKILRHAGSPFKAKHFVRDPLQYNESCHSESEARYLASIRRDLRERFGALFADSSERSAQAVEIFTKGERETVICKLEHKDILLWESNA